MSKEKRKFPDYDARWKTFIDFFAEATLARFFPNIAAQRDFTQPIKFVEKEFQKISPDWEKKGWTLGDKLMEVKLKNNKTKIVMVHFDIHKSHDRRFKKLMFQRCYRILDKYPDADFTAIAIYLSKDVPPEPDRFVYEYEGTKIIYVFNAFQIRNQNEAELLASDNPLDIAILAMYYLQQAGDDVNLRSRYKLMLTQLCFKKGYSKEEITNLIIFVGFTIALPDELEDIYIEKINIMIEENYPTLRELNPKLSQVIEKFALGTTLEEVTEKVTNDVSKKYILGFYESGVPTNIIAKSLNLELKFVEKIISDFEKAKNK